MQTRNRQFNSRILKGCIPLRNYVDVILAVLAVVKVGRGFRVTIPKEVRELLELEEG
ncbi:MAG: AbrB/MazE/SpoVT family DNA-binding domain-containing protein, partial [Candidatus Bathyarchaeia archaeon]